MLRGDNQHWLLCLPNPRPAVVPLPQLVLPHHFQLLLLRREPRGLLWRPHQQNSQSPFFNSFSQTFRLLFLNESYSSPFPQDLLRALVTYHRFISFSLYIGGFVWFVLSLVKKYYMRQFSLFAWTHVGLLICVTQSYLIIQNAFEGLIW